ncbi:MAG: WXG100 family type VII secretion target [Mycobacteriaceae bacterium]|nr:WXG100 family type VII secretion target [Mycobacteriaceae bacterium]MBV9640822.1 WXG100 family type VII secretion target [Mycobacteriaceae bacterium]
MSSDEMRVVTDDLTSSGMRVAAHAVDVAVRHASADARIAAAQAGWIGTSCAAMTAKATAWQEVTATLVGRLQDHANNFHASGQAYQQTDDTSAQSLRT